MNPFDVKQPHKPKKINVGFHENMSDEEYFAIDAINASTLKKVRSSPADGYSVIYGAPKKPSEAMKVGTAYHKLFLEGEKTFKAYYCKTFNPTDYPNAAKTVDDLKQLCEARGLEKNGLKTDLAARLLNDGVDRKQILDITRQDHNADNEGKIELKADLFDRLLNEYNIFKKHSKLSPLLKSGKAETVVIYKRENGQLLKAKIDFITKDGWVIDVKTIAPQGKDFKKACLSHLHSYKYHMQAYFYIMVLSLAIKQSKKPPMWLPKEIKGFKFLFIRKDGITDFLALEFKTRDENGHFYEYYRKAEYDIDYSLDLLNSSQKTIGDARPWLTDKEIILDDEHFPQYFLDDKE